MSFTVNAPAAISFTANGASSASFTVTGIIMTTGEGGGGGSVAWDDITGKPSTFTPATHSHAIADTTGLQAALDAKQAAGSYAAASHSHAIADTTGLQAALDAKQASLGFTAENAANKGVNNGYAELDSGGKVPVNRLPATLLVYKGVWNASTNSPALANNDVSKAGHVYNVGTAGTQFSIAFKLGDWLIYNDAGVIEKSDNSDDVVSVNGQQGVVVLSKSDVGLGNVDNTSDANKPVSSATQTALNAKQAVITTLESILGADVAMPSATVWYSGPSVTLPVGTWLVVGHLTHLGGASNGNVSVRMAAANAATGGFAAASRQTALACNGLVVVASGTTTVTLEAACSQASTTISFRTTVGTETGATKIIAIKIA
jgi:Phage tail repeat like